MTNAAPTYTQVHYAIQKIVENCPVSLKSKYWVEPMGSTIEHKYFYTVTWKQPNGRYLRAEFEDDFDSVRQKKQLVRIVTYKPWGPFRLDSHNIEFNTFTENFMLERLKEIQDDFSKIPANDSMARTIDLLK